MLNKSKGQQEQECLDKVKIVCFKDPNIDDFQYLTEVIFPGDALTYGFRYNTRENELLDQKPIAELILSVKNTDLQNAETGKKETKFPDFICNNGLIEHFQISGTEEIKSGSQIGKDRGKCNKDIDAAIKNGEQHVSESFSVCQSYEDFIASFKRNWEKHISKLDKYQGNKDNVCFMVENNAFGLVMELNPSLNYQPGITTGNIVKNYYDYCNRKEHFNSPLLGRCKELLEYIYQYKDEVQYVIFISFNKIEIIKTDMAKYIASLLDSYRYYSTITEEIHTADLYHRNQS